MNLLRLSAAAIALGAAAACAPATSKIVPTKPRTMFLAVAFMIGSPASGGVPRGDNLHSWRAWQLPKIGDCLPELAAGNAARAASTAPVATENLCTAVFGSGLLGGAPTSIIGSIHSQ